MQQQTRQEEVFNTILILLFFQLFLKIFPAFLEDFFPFVIQEVIKREKVSK
jgi:hypothetical protein